jgi:hypothetical protein
LALRQKRFRAAEACARDTLTMAGGAGLEYVDRIAAPGCSSFEDVSESVRRYDDPAEDAAWLRERFSPPLEPPTTSSLPRPPERRATAWRPKSLKDLLLPKAYARLMAWVKGNYRDMIDMRLGGEGCARPNKQQPVVIAQSEMVPEGRGVVWDLRDPENIVPLDNTAPIRSDLNLPFLKALLSACADQPMRRRGEPRQAR